MKIDWRYRILLLASFGLAGLSTAMANPLSALAAGAEKGTADVSLRYRLEHVDQNLPLKAANASTLKARITASTAVVEGWNALLEMDYVASLGPQRYNSFANGNTEYSVVADPVGSDLNQAWIGYRPNSSNKLVAGRQRILLGNQRFIGGVGWRQNEQTYDGFTYAYQTANTSLSYSYVWDVKRLFGGKELSLQTEVFHSDSHLLFGSWNGINGFVYALDFSNAASSSSLTYGLDYSGGQDKIKYGFALAQQQDYGSSPLDYSALYYRVSGAYEFARATLAVSYEVLGSDEGLANFSTPLGTLHAFQGWGDIFLSTGTSTGIPAGVEDLNVGLSGNVGRVSLAATAHHFSSNVGDMDYGTELDLAATLPLAENFSTQMKFAHYQADNFGVDTTKIWLTLSYTF